MKKTKEFEYPVIDPIGDCGFLISFGNSISPEISNKILALDQFLSQCTKFTGMEVVPALRSILVKVDPLENDLQQVKEYCQSILRQKEYIKSFTLEFRPFSIPVVYGGEFGPDLHTLCSRLEITEQELISLHTSANLRVVCLGFSPGLAYLSELPKAFGFPRKSTYTAEVPAGAILVANRQTAFPATKIPTGWHWIGTSPVTGFNPEKKKQFLFQPGDSIRFFAMPQSKIDSIDYSSYWE